MKDTSADLQSPIRLRLGSWQRKVHGKVRAKVRVKVRP